MKTRISICICLAVLMVAGGSHCVLAGNDSAPRCFDEGAAFLDKGEYDKAIAAFEKAIELQPEEERRVDSEFVKICHLKMGDCYHAKALSDPSEMIRAVSEYVASDDTGYQKVGECLMDIGNMKKAIRFLEFAKYSDKKAIDWLNQGNCYEDLGAIDAAIEVFTDGFGKFGDTSLQVQFQRRRADCYSKKGDYSSAVADYSAVCANDPNDVMTLVARGKCYYKLAYHDKGILDFSGAIRISPRSFEGYLNRGMCYGAKGEPDKELADYTEAIELAPTTTSKTTAYYSRALCLEKNNETDMAIADYDKLVELNPKDATAYRGRGALYRKKGDNDRAIADYTKAVELKPDSDKAFSERAPCHEAKGDADKAAQDKATAAGLTDYAALYKEAADLAAKGEHAKADIIYSRVIELKPDYGDAYFARGCCRETNDKIFDAIIDFTKAIELRSNLQEAYLQRATCYRLTEYYYTQAVADYTKYLEFKPDSAEAYYYRGLCGSGKNAISDLTRAIQLKPDYAEAYCQRGIETERENENSWKAAVKDYDKAIKLKPDYAEAYGERADVWWMHRNDYNKAIADYTKAIEFDQSNGKWLYYNGRAACYLMTKELDKEKADRAKALEFKIKWALSK